MVKKYSKLVTTLKHITPHKLRSTYGTSLYRETGDIYLVSDVLGHKDVNTTRKHYAALEDERRRSAAKYVKLREIWFLCIIKKVLYDILYHITLFLIHNNRMFMEDAFYCFIYYVSGNNILSIFSWILRCTSSAISCVFNEPYSSNKIGFR